MTSMTQQQMAAWDAGTFELMTRQAQVRGRLESLVNAVHVAAGDKKDGHGRNQAWRYTDTDALLVVAGMTTRDAARLIQDVSHAEELIKLLGTQIGEREQVWENEGWWSRYFPCLNRDGHIHSSLRGCQTVYWDTDMGWATGMSGLTADQAIHGIPGQFEGLGETLCSVCFPEAPAEWCRTRSEVTRAEREAARAAKDAERAAAKAVKNLTGAETARFEGMARYDRPTTVAAAKALVRQPAETRIELEWNRTTEASSRWSDPQQYAQFIARMEGRLAEEQCMAEVADDILFAREAAASGTGWTREDSDKAVASAVKRARSAYFK
jgi:hypothetical protein